MSNKPTIILVHGFWGGAAHWSKVIIELSHRGFTSLQAVELPLTSLADDVERTKKMIAQVDGDVILVGHSYGGAVITEAGNLPNVVGLVYIAAFAPDTNESPGRLRKSIYLSLLLIYHQIVMVTFGLKQINFMKVSVKI